MKALLELPGFKGKNGIGFTTRYKSTKDYLTDHRVLILMHFVVLVSQDFQTFMKPLQRKEPMKNDPCYSSKVHAANSICVIQAYAN